jgi:hypothetical protein
VLLVGIVLGWLRWQGWLCSLAVAWPGAGCGHRDVWDPSGWGMEMDNHIKAVFWSLALLVDRCLRNDCHKLVALRCWLCSLITLHKTILFFTLYTH